MRKDGLEAPSLLAGAISDLFDILGGALRDTSLEPELDDILWHVTDLFHKKAARVQRQLEDNEDRQKKSQDEQDGPEVRSVELERLIAEGQALIERREAFEQIRDLAAERYEAQTGSAWRPRAGSLVNHRHMTAAMIDSRDFIAARRRADTELMLPKGPKIAFSGGADYADAKLHLGRARQGARQASRHGAASMAARQKAPRKPPPAGPITAR